MKRMIIAVILIIAIVMGGTGCMYREYEIMGESQNATEQALKYLEEKYSETFTYAAPYKNDMFGSKEFFVTCKSLPGQRVWVQVEDPHAKNKVFRDNYLAVKYEQQTIDYVKELVTAHYPSVNIFYEANTKGLDLPVDADFSQYLREGSAKLIVMLELKESEFVGPEPFEQIAAEIEKTCNYITLTMIVTSDDVYGTMDRGELNDCLSVDDCVMWGKVRLMDGQLYTEWQGGKHE